MGLGVFGMEKEEFSFAIIKLEAINWHPVVDINDTCLKSLQGLLLEFGTGGVVTGEA